MTLKLVPFLISLLFAIDGFGQSKSISVPVYKSGDTTLFYKWQRERIAQMKMRDPLVSKDSLLLIFSTDTRAVEIFTNDFRTFYGFQYVCTTRYLSEEKRRRRRKGDPKLLFNVTKLDTAQAHVVYSVFKNLSILSIPDSQDIPGWPTGVDGITYLVEHSTPSSYAFKTYWTPSVARDRLREAAAIDDLSKKLDHLLGLHDSFMAFIDKLPAGTYHTGGIGFITTHKKRRGHKSRM
ncbi:hypothetical protein [Dyadobacter sp. BHUBP1]|uniref:hypothetical protein n=1 Tax=Dyadobacter sp. BHUBP1 TaxID=3424178 RepID=UPI003D332B04